MGLGVVAEVISAVALVSGIIFAAVQLRHMRAARQREAALELLHSFQTPTFARALLIVWNLPLGLGRIELEERLGEDMGLVVSLMATWESIGALVFLRELDFSMVDEFFSGPIIVSWRALEQYVREQREHTRRATAAEWFQWLAEQIAEHESSVPPVPAYEAHRDWRPRK
ncbi:MAG: hypothetical protein ABIK65_02955 [Candidatus Eisenbacteria bacterium]